MKIVFRPEHYPFWSQGHLESVKRIDAYARADNSLDIFGKLNPDGKPDESSKHTLAAKLGNLWFDQLTKTTLTTPTSELRIFFKDKSIDDLWILITWGK